MVGVQNGFIADMSVSGSRAAIESVVVVRHPFEEWAVLRGHAFQIS